MPLYEYQCDVCVHRFEVIQKFSDPHIDICPKCGGAVHKLFSSPAIQFKGSGFYITDYARGGKTEATESRNHGASDSRAKSDNRGGASEGTESRKHGETGSKTESKSESGSESKSTGTTETKSDSKSDSSTSRSSPGKEGGT
jgi:putative FmdB family regulatory protein